MTPTSNTPADSVYSNKQKGFLRDAIRNLLGAMGELDLQELSEGEFVFFAIKIEEILAKRTLKAKTKLVAAFRNGNGDELEVTLEQVEEGLAKARTNPGYKLPKVFIFENRRLVPVPTFTALQQLDFIGQFRAEMEKRAESVNSVPDAASAAAVG